MSTAHCNVAVSQWFVSSAVNIRTENVHVIAWFIHHACIYLVSPRFTLSIMRERFR